MALSLICRMEGTTISAELRTGSPGETEAAAERLARRLRAGDLLLLAGPMGAGKTAFVRGLARGMGVGGHVSSPTFQLVRIHDGDPGLGHVDIHRLADAAELDHLGLEDLLDSGVVAIEWGDRLERTPEGARTIRVVIEILDAGSRRLTLTEAPEGWSWF